MAQFDRDEFREHWLKRYGVDLAKREIAAMASVGTRVRRDRSQAVLLLASDWADALERHQQELDDLLAEKTLQGTPSETLDSRFGEPPGAAELRDLEVVRKKARKEKLTVEEEEEVEALLGGGSGVAADSGGLHLFFLRRRQQQAADEEIRGLRQIAADPPKRKAPDVALGSMLIELEDWIRAHGPAGASPWADVVGCLRWYKHDLSHWNIPKNAVKALAGRTRKLLRP